jgi:hypothetical protein
MKHTFEITDRPKDGGHFYTVRIDNGRPWMKDNSLSAADEKLRLFRELLAWMQADDKLDVSLNEVAP